MTSKRRWWALGLEAEHAGTVRGARPAGWLRHVVFGALVVNLITVSCLMASATAHAQGGERPVRIVAFGDSLTAGYLLPPGDSFPAQLERALKARGHRVEVANAGVSGDTTAAGRDRLAWSIPDDADAVILELGANDALRALDPKAARANLVAILDELKRRRLDVLIAGMRAPRNLGPEYVDAFDRIFPELAARYDALLYPFFLERIALKADLNLSDGIHPNARGVAEIVADILPQVEALIARVKARRARSG
ncbi:MAG: arylesterase [Hyphomicrobiales bacterium]|nr:arylesterase [Hyphomicrobiales bacterium]